MNPRVWAHVAWVSVVLLTAVPPRTIRAQHRETKHGWALHDANRDRWWLGDSARRRVTARDGALRRLIGSQPSVSFWVREGHRLFAQQRYRESVAAFEVALHFGAASPAILAAHIARAYAKLDNTQQATRWHSFARGHFAADLVTADQRTDWGINAGSGCATCTNADQRSLELLGRPSR